MSPTDAQADEPRVPPGDTPATPPTDDERAALRRTCRELAGHGPRHPADELEAVASWLRTAGPHGDPLPPDVYGTGAAIEDFERRVAELCGLPAARFMPSGCMAQPIALRIWSDRADNPHTAFHATSHLELHEEHGYRELHGLTAYLLGERHRPTTPGDLVQLLDGEAASTGLASLLVELPARELGGQLPTWDQAARLSELCRDRGVRLHLDGARLWQVPAAWGRSLPEICALFDSVYVSFYKDLGALAGAMLLGPEDFIDEAAVWQRRQGGTLYSNLAHVTSARLRLAEKLERMPRYRARALEVAELAAARPGLHVLPDPPHTNMFHLTFDAPAEEAAARRDHVARETGIWLHASPRPDDGLAAGRCRTELTIGEAALALEDGELARAFELLAD